MNEVIIQCIFRERRKDNKLCRCWPSTLINVFYEIHAEKVALFVWDGARDSLAISMQKYPDATGSWRVLHTSVELMGSDYAFLCDDMQCHWMSMIIAEWCTSVLERGNELRGYYFSHFICNSCCYSTQPNKAFILWSFSCHNVYNINITYKWEVRTIMLWECIAYIVV